MVTYTAKRLGWAVAQVVTVLVLVFVIVRILPGNPAQSLAFFGGVGGSRAAVVAIEARYHLNASLIVQFGYFLQGIAQGNLGESFIYRVPVSSLIAPVFPDTLALAAGALLVLSLIHI